VKNGVSLLKEQSPGAFQTTRWSVVLSGANTNGQSRALRDALSQLCQIYWRPIFSFICRRGYSVPDAQDLTQDFFVKLLDGHLLQRADRARGKFRSLLLKAVANFLNDAKDKQKTRKRGGDMQFVSWDQWAAQAPSRLTMPEQMLQNWSPERIFDLRWAATVVERALHRLADECQRQGRRRVFDILSGYLAADRADVSLVDLGRQLGAPPLTVKRLMHDMRERYRRLLREEVAATVQTPDSIDEELRYLCAALAQARS
jgi:RNA polymerase sigma-70 factor (ECF subfamily)